MVNESLSKKNHVINELHALFNVTSLFYKSSLHVHFCPAWFYISPSTVPEIGHNTSSRLFKSNRTTEKKKNKLLLDSG